MSTQFFERQADARKKTTWLIVMFFVALAALVAATFVATVVVSRGANLAKVEPGDTNVLSFTSSDLQIGFVAAAIAAVLILSGTGYKVLALRHGGGSSVAESIGGKRLFPDSAELAERRLLNVVEEMAIASGTPVPPVYVLDEPAINAFAAGYSPGDAVIGVTRGTLDNLSRDQLQGVIAHEFSHILNGDMRINIRLIGILHGILLLALIGKLLLRSVTYSGGRYRPQSGRARGNGVIAMLALGLVLLLLGSLGSLIGGLLKAAVSRQREYLADASAVQFTRNPGGLAGALKTIGGLSSHSRLKHPNAPVASHLFFAQGVFEGITGLMATHPPLRKRILAIDPMWDGVFPRVDTIAAKKESIIKPSHSPAVSALTPDGAEDQVQVPLEVVSQAAEQIADPQYQHQSYASRLIDELDPMILSAAREPYSARALVFALMLDRDASIRGAQLSTLSKQFESGFVQLIEKLADRTTKLQDREFLPLIDLTLSALAALSESQYRSFMRTFGELARSDARITIFEWTLAQVFLRNLRLRFGSEKEKLVRYYGIQRLTNELSVLLSTLARVGHGQTAAIQDAFDAGVKQLGLDLTLLPEEECTLLQLEKSLRVLSSVVARHRVRIVDACAATVCADGTVRVREAELLRGVADLLDCPMPPLIKQV